MSKQQEADLILKLYDLRREATMRKARDWYFRDFNPSSMADITETMFSDQSGYLRMVLTYWDMAAALVNHGAISLDLFDDVNGEHLAVYSKIEPFLTEMRSMNPRFCSNLEKLIDDTPQGRERIAGMRERFKDIHAQLAARKAATSGAKS